MLRTIISILIGLMMSSCFAAAQSGGWGTPISPPQKAPSAATMGVDKNLKHLDLASAEKVLEEAWDASPFFARNVTFVQEPAPMFGTFTARSNNSFKLGEKLLTYAEPVGYGYQINGANIDFGFVVDFVVKSKNGDIIGGQENFSSFRFASHGRNRELMLNLTLSFNGARPGDYVLEWKLRDQNSNKVAVISQPFSVVP